MKSDDILAFWFAELTSEQHFKKSEAVDREIGKRFGETLEAAGRGELWQWREEGAEGRLAEIIVLDQFSRNVYRDTPRMFENDPVALTLAQEMVILGLDKEIAPERRAFVYMPYMHSESRVIHEEAVRLFKALAREHKPAQENLKFEYQHKEIVDRFGRYPHRNAILGRESTDEEKTFLETHEGF